MENSPPTTDDLPHAMRWFAPWTWSLWLRIPLVIVLVIGAVIGFALASLMVLPFDIYISDVYIRSWR